MQVLGHRFNCEPWVACLILRSTFGIRCSDGNKAVTAWLRRTSATEEIVMAGKTKMNGGSMQKHAATRVRITVAADVAGNSLWRQNLQRKLQELLDVD